MSKNLRSLVVCLIERTRVTRELLEQFEWARSSDSSEPCTVRFPCVRSYESGDINLIKKYRGQRGNDYQMLDENFSLMASENSCHPTINN